MKITLKDLGQSGEICRVAVDEGPYIVSQVHKSGGGSDFFIKDAKGFLIAKLPKLEHAQFFAHARKMLPAMHELVEEIFPVLQSVSKEKCRLTDSAAGHCRTDAVLPCVTCRARRLVERMESSE